MGTVGSIQSKPAKAAATSLSATMKGPKGWKLKPWCFFRLEISCLQWRFPLFLGEPMVNHVKLQGFLFPHGGVNGFGRCHRDVTGRVVSSPATRGT